MRLHPRILVVDRSELAGNLYRLLFASLNATLIIRHRIKDARREFDGRRSLDLAVINTNALAGLQKSAASDRIGVGRSKGAPIIVLAKEGEQGCAWDGILNSSAAISIVRRPFDPCELRDRVKAALSEASG